ncbi:MAG: hypothetical protein M9947_07635 [Thermomicrobiales bacterium]|nr:hypothetical protein [Thermomicrobiales bacterium]
MSTACNRATTSTVVIDKQPHLQYLTLDEAEQHCIDGASIWHWASNEEDLEPDVVMAAAGDVPTQESLAAVEWLRERVPDMKVRVVNVVDLMSLFTPDVHPHGMDQTRFVDLFTADKPVIFAFHGYQRAIHEIVHGRVNPERFHVRGFNEEGTTTTPFDMVVLNDYEPLSPGGAGAQTGHSFSPAFGRPHRRAGKLDPEGRGLLPRAFRGPAGDRGWTWRIGVPAGG